MPTLPPSLLNALNGLPKKKTVPAPVNRGLGGESKADAPFTSPIIPGTTMSAGMNPGTGQNYQLTTSVPGFTPDYRSLLNADPLLGQATTDFSAQGVTDAASRNALINRALVQFGGSPDLGSAQKALGFNLGELVDPTTASLAAGNQYSTQATLDKALHQGISQLRASLAARGGLHSGALGIGLQQQNDAYGQAQNDATQGLLDHIGGYQSQYVAGQQAAAAALRQAQQEAAARTAALNPPTASATAALIYVDANGQPVYQHADGSLYNLDGSRYGGPGPGQAQQAAAQQAPQQEEAPQEQAPQEAAPIPWVTRGETGIPLSLAGTLPRTTGQTGIPLQVSGNFSLPNAYNTSKNKRG